MSETASSREIFAPYCRGLGLDIGFGGDAVVPHALTFDQVEPYTSVGSDRQILRGDCRDLSMFCDASLRWIHSAHLLEDFSYAELPTILAEWKRVLREGGYLLTNCPDQIAFLAHCEATGQPVNLAHKEPDFGLHNFLDHAICPTGPWRVIEEHPTHGAYSWLTIHKKL